MIKISDIYHAPFGSREPFRLEFEAEDLKIPEIEGKVTAIGQFMRVQEGIMMLLETLEATQTGNCARCGKSLSFPLPFKPSEWLFYETDPLPDDDENEHLKLDVHRLELDPLEPVRQDLILNLELKPQCEKPCVKFDESKQDSGLKHLAGLKDLIS